MIDANGSANTEVVETIKKLKKDVNGIYRENIPDDLISKNLSEKYNYPVISETIVCPDDFLQKVFNAYCSKISPNL
jgi:hypothetical protein